MGFVGLAFVCIGCLITAVGILASANIFGLVTKDERHHNTTTNNRVHKTNIWVLLTGLVLLAIGFALMLAAGA